jgi:peptidyl-prolyl cis-trans isomerase D
MLQLIRDRAQGIVVWVIVGLIILTFALFGLNSYLSGSSKSVVATVNGVEIAESEFTQEYQRNQEYFQKMLGENYNANLFDDKVMRKRVLDGLVQRELINQYLNDEHYHVAPQQVISNIQQIPAFRDESGNFSTERLNQVLSSQRMTADILKQRISRDLTNSYLQNGVQTSSIVTDQYLQAISRLQNQKRKMGYFLLPISSYLSKATVNDDTVSAYYENNSSNYRTPEKISVEYVELKTDSVTQNQTVTDKEASEYYQNNKENFITSKEARKVRHILIEVNDNVDEKTAKEQAQAIYQKLIKGANFSELASQESKDILSAKKGGDLGLLHRADNLDPVFENTVFKMKADSISKPVRSRFGYHIIQLEEIIPQKLKSFDVAKSQIKKDLGAERVDKEYALLADKLYTLSFENPDSLSAVSDELGLKIKKSDLFTRSGMSGLFGNKKLISAAFSDEVLNQNRNSDMLDVTDTHKVVLRLAEHQPSTIKPLEEVKQGIVNTLKHQQASKAVMNKAKTILSELKSDNSVNSLSKQYGIKWIEPGYIGRKPKSGSNINPAIRTAVFKLPVNKEGKASYDTVTLPDGGVAVISIYDVEKVKKEVPLEESERLRNIQQSAKLEFDAFMAYLKSTADIKLNLKSAEE